MSDGNAIRRAGLGLALLFAAAWWSAVLFWGCR
jgi:hypothetical protein